MQSALVSRVSAFQGKWWHLGQDHPVLLYFGDISGGSSDVMDGAMKYRADGVVASGKGSSVESLRVRRARRECRTYPCIVMSWQMPELLHVVGWFRKLAVVASSCR